MKAFIEKYLSSVWPAVLWSAIIFLLLAIPSPRLPNEKLFVLPHFDKLVHALLFFILVYLWASYITQKKKISSNYKLLLWIATVASVYGILLEYVQLFTGRDFDVLDMLADAAGAFACAFLLKKISPGGNRGRNQN